PCAQKRPQRGEHQVLIPLLGDVVEQQGSQQVTGKRSHATPLEPTALAGSGQPDGEYHYAARFALRARVRARRGQVRRDIGERLLVTFRRIFRGQGRKLLAGSSCRLAVAALLVAAADGLLGTPCGPLRGGRSGLVLRGADSLASLCGSTSAAAPPPPTASPTGLLLRLRCARCFNSRHGGFTWRRFGFPYHIGVDGLNCLLRLLG